MATTDKTTYSLTQSNPWATPTKIYESLVVSVVK